MHSFLFLFLTWQTVIPFPLPQCLVFQEGITIHQAFSEQESNNQKRERGRIVRLRIFTNFSTVCVIDRSYE